MEEANHRFQTPFSKRELAALRVDPRLWARTDILDEEDKRRSIQYVRELLADYIRIAREFDSRLEVMQEDECGLKLMSRDQIDDDALQI